ncbi:Phosphate regulon sensor protein PhoR (SphS) [hydrothermal vent metagenome]|uniref:histidine kinase n=1 Tax=hydrothermal vent metagenome TaxID=652676 RepID=A0A3B1ABC9_9ZZZZ
MQPQFQRELWFLFFLIFFAAVIGSAFNLSILFVSIVLFSYIIFTFLNISKLHHWLLHRKDEPLPDGRGYWGEIFHELFLMEKVQAKNKLILHETILRFQDATTALPDAMIILNKHQRIDWSNNAAESLVGVRYPEDAHQPISNLIRAPEFMKYLNKKDYNQVLNIPSPEHPAKQLAVQIIPYVKAQTLIICRDISHINKLEEMRSSFVANASHELRSPITVISGYLETMQNNLPSDPDKLSKVINTMYGQSKRMERLVNDLLSLSKLETRPTDQHDNEIDISALLTAIKESAIILSGDKKHDIELNIKSKSNISGNYEELYSLFSNLVNNAVRYTPIKGHILILWEEIDKQIVFSVTDSGHGIPMQHIPHLTERFYRVNVDRSRESGGTGLGLAIVKHIVERHDGRLEINSKINVGSTFRCLFPTTRLIKH